MLLHQQTNKGMTMSDTTQIALIPTPTSATTGARRTHPVMIIAGCAFAVFCIGALGMISGVIPTAYSQSGAAKLIAPVCANCGSVESVRKITAQGQANGTGAVIGGVVGGVLGNQVGGGRGKDVATVAGVVAGGVAGHQIEKSTKSVTYFDIKVRMEDGTLRSVRSESDPGLMTGDRVKIENNRVVRNR
jgi:outer membrane lipoprotein SlyB